MNPDTLSIRCCYGVDRADLSIVFAEGNSDFVPCTWTFAVPAIRMCLSFGHEIRSEELLLWAQDIRRLQGALSGKARLLNWDESIELTLSADDSGSEKFRLAGFVLLPPGEIAPDAPFDPDRWMRLNIDGWTCDAAELVRIPGAIERILRNVGDDPADE